MEMPLVTLEALSASTAARLSITEPNGRLPSILTAMIAVADSPAAIAWLKRSTLGDGKVARYYELETNRPLYMERQGKDYSLTYDDTNLPDHYGWKNDSKVVHLEAALKYNELKKTVELIEYEKEILESKLENYNIVKSKLNSLIRLRERELLQSEE